MALTQHGDLVSLDAPVPTCCGRDRRVSYVLCRRCDAPICADCRTASRLGHICPRCVTELRDADSTLVAPPLPIGTVIASLVLLLCGIAQMLSPDLSRYLAYAPFATLVEPWRILTGLLSFASASLVPTMILAVVALALCGAVVESTRGLPSFLATALTTGIAGSASVYLVTGSESSAWYSAVFGPYAAIAGLIVAGAGAAMTLRRPAYLVPLLAAVLMLGASAWLMSPFPLVAVAGGTTAAAVMEIVRAFFHKPQRALMPLMVSGLVAWALVIIAFLIRSLLL